MESDGTSQNLLKTDRIFWNLMEPGGISWNISCTEAFQNLLALSGTFHACPRVYINPLLLLAPLFSFFFFFTLCLIVTTWNQVLPSQ